MPPTTPTTWRKSTRSAQQGDCVELAPIASTIALRDSKDPDGGQLAFSRREWAAFTAKIKQER